LHRCPFETSLGTASQKSLTGIKLRASRLLAPAASQKSLSDKRAFVCQQQRHRLSFAH
jgi:hypothetical protein